MTICSKNASLDPLRSRWSRCKASLRAPHRTSVAVPHVETLEKCTRALQRIVVTRGMRCGRRLGEDWGLASIWCDFRSSFAHAMAPF
jgi:hypothetical protein